jgi:hypothetical protein
VYTEAFWQAFRRRAGLDHYDYVIGFFADSSVMSVVNFLDLPPFLNHSRIVFRHCECVG